jgi:hypothetical protein
MLKTVASNNMPAEKGGRGELSDKKECVTDHVTYLRACTNSKINPPPKSEAMWCYFRIIMTWHVEG